jgi:hypothetical protein
MVRRYLFLALVALGLAALTPAPSQAQIVNGNFDVGNPFVNWQGSAGTSFVNTGSHTPTQSIIFRNASATLSQTFNATAGQYFLSFWMRAVTAAPVAIAAIDVLVNGQLFGGLTIGTNYGETTTAALTLQSGSNTIQFLNSNAGNGSFVQLDTVSFQAVPTPMAGAGVLSFAALGVAFGWSRLRRRRPAAG